MMKTISKVFYAILFFCLISQNARAHDAGSFEAHYPGAWILGSISTSHRMSTWCGSPSAIASAQQFRRLTATELAQLNDNSITQRYMQKGKTYQDRILLRGSGHLANRIKKLRIQYPGPDIIIPINVGITSGGHEFMVFINPYDFKINELNLEGDHSFVIKYSIEDNDGKVYIQFAVKAVVIGKEVEQNSTWTTTAPAIPQLILRNPPGDGSYSYLEKNTQVCYGYGMSMATDASASAFASVKLGTKGSSGFIVETEYEAYAELSASVEMGVQRTSQNQYNMCFTSTQQFSTNENNPYLTGSKGDVYMGAIIEYEYGIFHSVIFKNCEVEYKKELIIAPIGHSPFLYTEEHIQNFIIPNLEDDTEANNQREIWEQALEMNREIKSIAPLKTVKRFSGGANEDFSESLSTSTSKTLDMNLYIDAQVALEVGVYVGNTGGSAGVAVKARNEFGNSNTTENSNTNTIGYYLGDNDENDHFAVEIREDPVFGMPVFELIEDESASSCPWEKGSYQLDQPRLTFANNSSKFTVRNIPAGTEGTFNLNVCNDSDYKRTYHLKFDASTNQNNAIIRGFGAELNNTDDGIALTIPANSCLENASLSIKQESVGVRNYNGIKLVLYVLCQEDAEPIESSVTLNARFLPEGHDEVCLDNEINAGLYNLSIESGLSSNRKYLSCNSNGSVVDLWRVDDSSGRQQWKIEAIPGKPDLYHISIIKGLSSNKKYLSSNSTGSVVDLWHVDDNSGRQQWKIEAIPGQTDLYRIYIVKGLSTDRKYLSCTPDGKVDLWKRDDNSGRQRFRLKKIDLP